VHISEGERQLARGNRMRFLCSELTFVENIISALSLRSNLLCWCKSTKASGSSRGITRCWDGFCSIGMYVCIYMYVYVCICVYIWLQFAWDNELLGWFLMDRYVYIYIYVYIYMYVYTYIR